MKRVSKSSHSKVIAISSGKQGVGKTNICANLGILLAKQGFKVCVVDADQGLANLNVVLGLVPENNNFGVISNVEELQSAVQQSEYGIDLLSVSSDMNQISDSVVSKTVPVKVLFKLLRDCYDVILVDTETGINAQLKNYLNVADVIMLVLTSEPASLTDSFGLIRALKNNNSEFNVVTNKVSGAPQANSVFRRFSNAVKKYVGLEVSQLGYIIEDPYVPFAVLRRLPIVEHRPECMASQGLIRLSQTIARNLEQKTVSQNYLSGLPANPQLFKHPEKEQIQIPSFEKWLQQFPQFFGSFTDNHQQRVDRFKQFRVKLLTIIKKNKDFANEFNAFVDELRPVLVKSKNTEKKSEEVMSGDASWLSNMQLFSSKKKIAQASEESSKTNIAIQGIEVKGELETEVIVKSEVAVEEIPQNRKVQLIEDLPAADTESRFMNILETTDDIQRMLKLIEEMNLD